MVLTPQHKACGFTFTQRTNKSSLENKKLFKPRMYLQIKLHQRKERLLRNNLTIRKISAVVSKLKRVHDSYLFLCRFNFVFSLLFLLCFFFSSSSFRSMDKKLQFTKHLSSLALNGFNSDAKLLQNSHYKFFFPFLQILV